MIPLYGLESTGLSELVWDSAQEGTAYTLGDSSVHVSERRTWTAEQLLTTAAQASIMTGFLGLAEAAGVHVSGYMSAGSVEYRGKGPGIACIRVRPCAVVDAPERVDEARLLLERARRESPIGLSLNIPIRMDATVVATEPCAP